MSDSEKRDDADVLDAIKAREIVSEIMNFGVSESQLLKIIQFLSYELEDREVMMKISDIFTESGEGVEQSKPDITI